MMLEARKHGFDKVLWIDTSMLPLKDPTPLVLKIEEEGCLSSHLCQPCLMIRRVFFQKQRQLLRELTGIDVVITKHFSTQVLFLKMDAEKTKNFVKTYYDYCEIGTPFLSCFPEEFVFASIFLKSEEDCGM